ncbi:MAG: SGNH/GDSL hydrolase family protein [Deltaproteobacteria bacterium]|nr:SGNH/GDSL hydrolase family protein [Deltaproteobacteria bacterium]
MVRFLKEYRLGRFLGVIRRRPSAGLGAVLLGTIVGLAMMEAALRTVAWAHMRRMAHPAQQFTRADALKILCVGDSFTFGLGVEEDETYPVYLQNFLADRLRPRAVEVVNRGLPSRNSAEILWMLERALNRDRIKPDLVLIAAGVNDTWNRHWAEKIPDEGFPAKVDRVAGLRALRFAKIAFGQGPVRAGRFSPRRPKRKAWIGRPCGATTKPTRGPTRTYCGAILSPWSGSPAIAACGPISSIITRATRIFRSPIAKPPPGPARRCST